MEKHPRDVDIENIKEDIREIKRDVRTLLQFKWRVIGGSVVVGFIGSVLTSILVFIIKNNVQSIHSH